eukprot:TRINITY_DN8595_c0_g1_i3.p3 TRINITY_DN8595_c0_g1~~TRINITY_DN8595_c0_g1_i3.p3  ORF type:complete len:143 (+),score=16.79 TRINITY_DN8595_c0_g1_i3:480-908(+)
MCYPPLQARIEFRSANCAPQLLAFAMQPEAAGEEGPKALMSAGFVAPERFVNIHPVSRLSLSLTPPVFVAANRSLHVIHNKKRGSILHESRKPFGLRIAWNETTADDAANIEEIEGEQQTTRVSATDMDVEQARASEATEDE